MMNFPNQYCGCFPTYNCPRPSIYKPSLDYTVSVPINLAKSLEGKYFVGYADNLTFGEGTANQALCPLPKPKIKLQYANNVTGEPIGGIKAFVRRGQPETT